MKKLPVLLLTVLLFGSLARAQTAEVSIRLDEPFFDALLDALFKNPNPPEFPLSQTDAKPSAPSPNALAPDTDKDRSPKTKDQPQSARCNESIRLQREIDGTRTAVRFRDGKIYAPIAFTGSYNPPLIGCVDFAGYAETIIDLDFDAQKQALVGRARVLSVNLSGTGGIGSQLLARMVQSSIDRRINPIQILSLDRVSFVVPIQNSGTLRMKATGIRHEIANGALDVRISYEFQ
ncbi:MAG: hypothetical protein JSS81_18730 [Acidobacteria bacterium]|nr:hypothetical protein [Acidobacteriota bacterium]